jgi:hypothetical protein
MDLTDGVCFIRLLLGLRICEVIDRWGSPARNKRASSDFNSIPSNSNTINSGRHSTTSKSAKILRKGRTAAKREEAARRIPNPH